MKSAEQLGDLVPCLSIFPYQIHATCHLQGDHERKGIEEVLDCQRACLGVFEEAQAVCDGLERGDAVLFRLLAAQLSES